MRDGQRQCIRAVARPCDRLRRGRLDLIFGVREKVECAGIGGAGRRRQRQNDSLSVSARFGAPSAVQTPRQRRARGGDRGAPLRIHLRAFRDRQRELEIGTVGNAGFLAHEPIGARRELRSFTGLRVARNVERHEMQDRSFVTVVDERPDLQRLRRRPFDRAGVKMRRQLPIDRRRQPRIAGIAPIGMPTVLDLEAQRDGRRPARNDGGTFGDELGFDMGRLDRRRARERRVHEQRERATQPKPSEMRHHRFAISVEPLFHWGQHYPTGRQSDRAARPGTAVEA